MLKASRSKGRQGKADLTGSWISVRQSGGNTFKRRISYVAGSLKISNIGTADAPPFYIGLYLSDGTEDVLLQRIRVGAIRAGSSKIMRLNANLPQGASASGKSIIALIDADNTVDESDKNNNRVVYEIP